MRIIPELFSPLKFLAAAFIAVAVSFSPSDNTPLSNVKITLESLKKDPALKHASISFCLLNAKTDSVVHQLNPELTLSPASSFKVVTTAAALGILGENYTYETQLLTNGRLDSASGILGGDLIIRGSGDPALDSKYFSLQKKVKDLEGWVLKLKEKGLRKIAGRIIFDASVFEKEMIPPTWIWSDMGNYYGAGACGISYHDNLYTAFFNSGSAGTGAYLVKIHPAVPGLVLDTKVTANGSEDNAYIYGAPYNYQRYVTGTIPPNKNLFEVDGSLPDPARMCAYVFDSLLRMEGVSIEKTPVAWDEIDHTQNNTLLQTLYVHKSPPLGQLVFYTNKFSVNLYAETLIKTIGKGSLSNGESVLKDYWTSKGVNTSGLYINDGSGLSRWNAISSHHLASMLAKASKEVYFKTFYNSLPTHSEKVAAKSGYITRVRSYAGYVRGSGNTLYSFAVVVNNYDCSAREMRLKLEKFLNQLGTL